MPDEEKEQTGSEEQIAGPALMADRIASARREAGYRTAQDFAEALTLSVWTVRSWESAKSQPRYHVLREISRLTGRPIAWFLGESPGQQELERAMEGILQRHQFPLRPNTEQTAEEAGVYGIAPLDAAAQRQLNALSEDARGWGMLLRLTAAIPPATAEQIVALHLALAGLAGAERQPDAPE